MWCIHCAARARTHPNPVRICVHLSGFDAFMSQCNPPSGHGLMETSLPTQGMNSIDSRGRMDWIKTFYIWIFPYLFLAFSFSFSVSTSIHGWILVVVSTLEKPNYLSHKQICLWRDIRSGRFCELLPGHCCEIGARVFVVSGTKQPWDAPPSLVSIAGSRLPRCSFSMTL